MFQLSDLSAAKPVVNQALAAIEPIVNKMSGELNEIREKITRTVDDGINGL